MIKQILFLWIFLISFISFSSKYNFTGDHNIDGMLLTWDNAEIQCEYYTVKRSVDGFPFERITKIEVDTKNKGYEFLDKLFLIHEGAITYELTSIKNGKEVILSTFFIENIYEREMEISPNPTEQGIVTIEIYGIEKEQGVIDIYTPMGEVLYSTNFEFSSNHEVKTVDVRNFIHREKLYIRVMTEYSTKIMRLFFN